MRIIPLADDDGNPLDDAFYRVRARGYFPDDDAAAEQALMLANHEADRFRALGPDGHSISAVTKAVIKTIEQQNVDMAVCSLVAVVLGFRSNAIQAGNACQTSLNEAAKVVSEYVYSQPNGAKTDFFSFAVRAPASLYLDDGTPPPVKTRSLPGDIATIKSAFRKFQSVAHIYAAQLVCAETCDFRWPFERYPVPERLFIATAIDYQHRLKAHKGFRESDPWLLGKFPRDIAEYPPLQPSDELYNALLRPWFAAKQSAALGGDARLPKGGAKNPP